MQRTSQSENHFPQHFVQRRLTHFWILLREGKLLLSVPGAVNAGSWVTAQKLRVHYSSPPCAHYAFDLSPPKREKKKKNILATVINKRKPSAPSAFLVGRRTSSEWQLQIPPELKAASEDGGEGDAEWDCGGRHGDINIWLHRMADLAFIKYIFQAGTCHVFPSQ